MLGDCRRLVGDDLEESNQSEDPDIAELRLLGVSDDDIEKYIESKHVTNKYEDCTLVVMYNNLSAFYWLQNHPLIWSYGNDTDGVRLLLGMDYDRIHQILKSEIPKSVFSKKSRDALFFRLMKIEIGAKASFDTRLSDERRQKALQDNKV